MIFKNPRYQKIHDEINENRKRLGLKNIEESLEEWKAAGMQKYDPSEEYKKSFEEWRDNPRRDEIERNNKMMVEGLREIHENLGKNMAEPELRKRKKTKPKLKKKIKRCKCK